MYPMLQICYNTAGEKWKGMNRVVVIFDPEGILTDTAACRFAAWREMAREQGILWEEAQEEQLRDLDEETHLQSILSRAHRGYSAAERLALLTRQRDLYVEYLLRMGESVARPGAAEMLNALRRSGAALGAVMTDGTPGQVLRYMPWQRGFQVVSRKTELSSQLADVQLKLNASPTHCLLVTVHPESAKTARSLGMQALLCGAGEDNGIILTQILAILPDFSGEDTTF